ncbi:MAG: type I-PGING CRISPR-associated protein Cas8c/Csp2 [Bacteroidia bacterium]|nr:type I-PGING CRISPR-associated protein Cas8c/Csp2 [Bacteroidia bacterium]
MEFSHPYSRYGLALVMLENEVDNPENVTNVQIRESLIWGLNHFRMKPSGFYEGANSVKFDYMPYEYIMNNKEFQSKGKTDEGIFLSPNIITSDKGAGQTWNAVNSLVEKLDSEKSGGTESLTMSLFAASAKFNNGKKSQSTPKASMLEVACAAITNITQDKPCLAYNVHRKGRVNTAIIPDLKLSEMMKFIVFFRKMLYHETNKNLFTGKVSFTVLGKGISATAQYKPQRPNIYNGNFPNSPKSSAMGSIALLAAIGEWAKRSGNYAEGSAVLDSLVNTPIYMISYGNAKSFTFNHYVIELAKNAQLNTIVDSIYYSKVFNTKWRSFAESDVQAYQKFDLFASRFLQLFNRPALKDFLASRAEYPYQLDILFTTYFTKMEKINEDIVKSAKELGRWLNYVAYLAAKGENSNTRSEDFMKAKAKVLVEIESSAFSAKSGHALIAQVVTRAGRLSQMDAPPDATLFMEKTCSGELPIDHAKNLLMAFSRLRNKYEKPATEDVAEEVESDGSDETKEYAES